MTLSDELNDPRVVSIYAARYPQEIRLPANFFTRNGWQPDAPYYCGTFDPQKQWKSKAKGELMLRFDDMPKCVMVTVRSLLDYNFSITAVTQQFNNSDDSDDDMGHEGADSSDEDQLVRDLPRPRNAAKNAREKMSELSPAGSS